MARWLPARGGHGRAGPQARHRAGQREAAQNLTPCRPPAGPPATPPSRRPSDQWYERDVIHAPQHAARNEPVPRLGGGACAAAAASPAGGRRWAAARWRRLGCRAVRWRRSVTQQPVQPAVRPRRAMQGGSGSIRAKCAPLPPRPTPIKAAGRPSLTGARRPFFARSERTQSASGMHPGSRGGRLFAARAGGQPKGHASMGVLGGGGGCAGLGHPPPSCACRALWPMQAPRHRLTCWPAGEMAACSWPALGCSWHLLDSQMCIEVGVKVNPSLERLKVNPAPA
jgi:hypothetical protein